MERLSIPPEFSSYAEEKGVFTLYENMLQALLAARPDNPLEFLSNYLSVDRAKSELRNMEGVNGQITTDIHYNFVL